MKKLFHEKAHSKLREMETFIKIQSVMFCG